MRFKTISKIFYHFLQVGHDKYNLAKYLKVIRCTNEIMNGNACFAGLYLTKLPMFMIFISEAVFK